MDKLLKVVKVLLNTLTMLIIILGIIFLILYVIGIKPFVVQSGSMEDSIQTGSVSFINTRTKYEDIKVGDVIGYKTNSGTRVMHRVVEIDSEGLHTKGDANETIDGTVVTGINYIGKAIFWVPKIGFVVGMIQTRRGVIVLSTLIAVFVISVLLLGESSKKDKKKDCDKPDAE